MGRADGAPARLALVFVPVRWLERYGWRPLCCHERTATYVFYRELGRRMGINAIPPSYEAFFDAYERSHFACTDASRRLMQASHEAWASYVPALLAPVAGTYIDALLAEPVAQAVGVRPPPRLVRTLVHLLLRARAQTLRLLPRRREPVEPDQTRYGVPIAEVYPDGYEIGQLGPPPPRDVG